MNITLFRSGKRALILPRERDLLDCPPIVRLWLGTPFTEAPAEITADTAMPDIAPPLVLAEILQKGFCALDELGVVRAFSAPPPMPLGDWSLLDLTPEHDSGQDPSRSR